MKKRICGILVATQLMGMWLAAAAGTGPANAAIAVSQRTLDFAPIGVGKSRNLSFTVQNVGAGILTGEAKVSGPFSVVGGSPYVLGSSQSQVITVKYLPKAAGMTVTGVILTGGGGARVTVAGSAFPDRSGAPAPPTNLRVLARR